MILIICYQSVFSVDSVFPHQKISKSALLDTFHRNSKFRIVKKIIKIRSWNIIE